MQKKKQKRTRRTRILLRLFEIVSLLIAQWTLNLQESVPASTRQTALYMYMLEQVVAKKEKIHRPFVNTFASREK